MDLTVTGILFIVLGELSLGRLSKCLSDIEIQSKLDLQPEPSLRHLPPLRPQCLAEQSDFGARQPGHNCTTAPMLSLLYLNLASMARSHTAAHKPPAPTYEDGKGYSICRCILTWSPETAKVSLPHRLCSASYWTITPPGLACHRWLELVENSPSWTVLGKGGTASFLKLEVSSEG